MDGCTLEKVLSGGCSLWEMMTGEVLVGLLQTVVAIGAVWVAIWQIRKQERLTREQIQAATEATQKQLEEMGKAVQPEVDIIFTKEQDLCIEVFNGKNIPVYVRGYNISIKWYTEGGNVILGVQTGDRFMVHSVLDVDVDILESDDLCNAISSDEKKILGTGESYKLDIKYDFFKRIVDPEFLLNELDHPLEELKSVTVVITFDIPGIDPEARFTFKPKRGLPFSGAFDVVGKASPKGNVIRFNVISTEDFADDNEKEKPEEFNDVEWNRNYHDRPYRVWEEFVNRIKLVSYNKHLRRKYKEKMNLVEEMTPKLQPIVETLITIDVDIVDEYIEKKKKMIETSEITDDELIIGKEWIQPLDFIKDLKHYLEAKLTFFNILVTVEDDEDRERILEKKF